MQPDLFGGKVIEQTPEQRYAEYINSAKWKRRCELAIARAGSKCQRCGRSKYTRRLEVHHLTYERLGHERDEDLLVVCHECHTEADTERQQEEERKKRRGPMVAGFEAWLDRGNDPNWRYWSNGNIQRAWGDFVHYINHLNRTDYPVTECPLLREPRIIKPDFARHLPLPHQPEDPDELPFSEPLEPEDM